MFLIFLLLVIFLGYGIIELRNHHSNVHKIPIRIQVNGTRGKSSVTRLIAGGLRASGMRTLAKTTGTKPRFIISDQEEFPIKRLGKANILEEIKIFRQAKKYRPQAMVIECMALVPEYQRIECEKLVQTTHGVITNVRADHLDVMGPTVKDVAIALANTIPKNGYLFTAENFYLPYFKKVAKKRNTKLYHADPNTVTDEEMKGFSYIEHKENVALALLVCEHFGVGRKTALAGMYRAKPDSGVMRIYTIDDFNKRIKLVYTMAANDPDSIMMLWTMCLNRFQTECKEVIVLINCRDDRADRSKQLGELCAQKMPANYYLATGFLTSVFIRSALNNGIAKDKIIDLGGKSPAEIYAKTFQLIEKDGLVFATGNTVGFGEMLINYFAQKGVENDY
jgi:poly-gamma-glutamate synthase PgsB/CapB